MRVGAIVIGRNEGVRLIRCLEALDGQANPVIYVDSASTDGSCDAAQDRGAEVVRLDMTRPFTAARARNAGFERLRQIDNDADFVQVIDGDCELRSGWIEAATQFLITAPDVAAVAGRLREKRAEATLWNKLADGEWETPIGDIESVGGIALLRRAAVEAVGGYREDLIAGEEPEMCLRLRRAGWRIHRLGAEMALHDIAMTRFSQWWRRTRRGGYAFADAVRLHGRGPERFRVAQTRRALIWGAFLPLASFAGLFTLPWGGMIWLIWPLQVMRLKRQGLTWTRAVFLTIGKVAEAQGILENWWARLWNRHRGLIEYK